MFLDHYNESVYYESGEPRSGVILKCKFKKRFDIRKIKSYGVFELNSEVKDPVLGNNFLIIIPCEDKYLTDPERVVPAMVYKNLDALTNESSPYTNCLERGFIHKNKDQLAL